MTKKIKTGTIVKLVDGPQKRKKWLDDWWYVTYHKVERISDDNLPRYYMAGLYFWADDLIVFDEDEYPEHYI